MKSFLFFVRHQDGGGVIFEKCLPLVFSSSLILLPVCDEWPHPFRTIAPLISLLRPVAGHKKLSYLPIPRYRTDCTVL